MNNNVEEKFEIPVLFIIFNRLDKTKKVFKAIKEIKPTKLYIASDGPRNEEELLKVQAVRDYVTSECDWQCTLNTRFREVNLGVGFGPNDAIDWFFSNEESGIILEDDCLPSKSFFYFCDELLNIYKDNKTIGVIQGFNPFPKEDSYPYSLLFSKYDLKWGWATWRDRWQYQDMYTKDFEETKKSGILKDLFPDKNVRLYWENIFEEIHRNPQRAWDTQFTYQMLKRRLFTIVPKKNLVLNIGYDVDASSTKWGVPEHIKKLNLEKLYPPYIHPTEIKIDKDYDSLVERVHFEINIKTVFITMLRNILESNAISRNLVLPLLVGIYRFYKYMRLKLGK